MMGDDALAGDGVTARTEHGGPDEAELAGGDFAGAAEGEEGQTDQPPAPGDRKRMSFLTEIVILVTVALTIALLIKSFLVQPFYIPSPSMENTLQLNDKILVNKLVYDFRPIGRGDIVVFDGTGSWNPPAAPVHRGLLSRLYNDTLGKLFSSIGGLFGANPGQTYFVKRVIGVPGDHVKCCTKQGLITVNGIPLHESGYLFPGSQPSTLPFSVVVPAGRLWVMGDNRVDSQDSRYYNCTYQQVYKCSPWDRDGTIPESMVVGRAFMIVWPPSRIQILRVPPIFGQPALQHSVPGAVGSGGPGARVAEVLAAGGFRVTPAAPYLPLAAGIGVAVPLTYLVRRVRLRPAGHRRRSRRAARRG